MILRFRGLARRRSEREAREIDRIAEGPYLAHATGAKKNLYAPIASPYLRCMAWEAAPRETEAQAS